jgi:hypothetical protein
MRLPSHNHLEISHFQKFITNKNSIGRYINIGDITNRRTV